MGTIQLDPSDPAPFENFVSQNDREEARIVIGILVGAIVLYIGCELYEDYKTNKRSQI